MTIHQAFDLAVWHHQAGRLAEAEAIFRQILTHQPDHSDALNLLGIIAHQTKQNQKAVELIGRAIAINSAKAAYHNNLGQVLRELGRTDEAIEAYRTAIKLQPNFANAQYNLGIALMEFGKSDEAVAALRAAIQLQPDDAAAHNSLGVALRHIRKPQEAQTAFRAALKCKPNYPEAFLNLGNLYRTQGQMDQAIATYRAALAQKPDIVQAQDNLILSLHFHPNFDARAIQQEQRRWMEPFIQQQEKFIRPHKNPDPHRDDPERRLKIGYVSADFCEHPCNLFLDPLLRHHDRNQFEIFCYAHVSRPDPATQKIRSYADQWRDILRLTDQQAAEQIRQDSIDILVDLKLHTAENRLRLFAIKPAPVQATWLGYPGSTGMNTIDYRLSDPYIDPPESDLGVYSEQTLRLPRTFWCYDPLTSEPRANELPALRNGHITLGCMNQFIKINYSVLHTWAKILYTLPNSRLILVAPPGGARESFLNQLQQYHIDPARVDFIDRQPRLKYLEQFHKIDFSLDPFPYNGGTTSLESLWMGVPVVTLRGRTAVGRSGTSILNNIGLPELVANTPDEYIQIAAKLANDLPRLTELRKTLRQRMERSPLMDAKGFARDIEAAYREMWRRWCDAAVNRGENR